jgi:hypothetical protein
VDVVDTVDCVDGESQSPLLVVHRVHCVHIVHWIREKRGGPVDRGSLNGASIASVVGTGLRNGPDAQYPSRRTASFSRS